MVFEVVYSDGKEVRRTGLREAAQVSVNGIHIKPSTGKVYYTPKTKQYLELSKKIYLPKNLKVLAIEETENKQYELFCETSDIVGVAKRFDMPLPLKESKIEACQNIIGVNHFSLKFDKAEKVYQMKMHSFRDTNGDFPAAMIHLVEEDRDIIKYFSYEKGHYYEGVVDPVGYFKNKEYIFYKNINIPEIKTNLSVEEWRINKRQQKIDIEKLHE